MLAALVSVLLPRGMSLPGILGGISIAAGILVIGTGNPSEVALVALRQHHGPDARAHRGETEAILDGLRKREAQCRNVQYRGVSKLLPKPYPDHEAVAMALRGSV